MVTKTFHDIYDLVELVSMLKNGGIDISTHDGAMIFSITNYSDEKCSNSELLKVGNASFITAFHENVEKAYQILLEKIASGEWEKNDDCA